MEKSISIHINNENLEKLKELLLATTSDVNLYICVPSIIDNMSNARRELILIIRGLILMLHNNTFSKYNDVTKNLIRKYATTAQLLFIKLHEKCDVKLTINDSTINGYIQGVNSDKYFAIVTANNDKLIVNFDEIFNKNELKHGGGTSDMSSAMSSTMSSAVSSAMSSDMSKSYKSYDFIESHKTHSSPISENNYFSELTSIEEGLCE